MIAENRPLFSLLGTTFGGDGVSTFALPDLQGRTVVGSGGGFDVGDLLGERLTTLTTGELTPHDHTLLDDGDGGDGPGGVPEPATWAMMILGVGLSGAALRRRPALA
jgi:microcystin-dependent protein